MNRTDETSRMSEKDLESFRKLILEKKRVVLLSLKELKDNSKNGTPRDQSGDLSTCSFHMADDASNTRDREVAFGLASVHWISSRQLNEALERIEDGTYGNCLGCGELISIERLKAVPSALRCVQCQNEMEKKQRGR